MKNILIISPHPDDEAIGCGGTICKHIADGDHVEVVFLTSGGKGGHGKSEEETSSTREHEAMRAAEILKVNKIEFWRQPDGKFEADAFNVNRLKDKIQSMKTDIIYVPHEGEDHQDHKAAASLVMQAISEPGTTFTKPLVWMYEVWTPIQKIDHIVDISPYVDIKREAILCHKSQCDVLKFDEAILGLNRYRGEMHSCPGGDFAEVFTNLKESN